MVEVSPPTPVRVVEGLSNKAKVTMRKSYGFRTFRCLELAVYHSLGKLPEPESTKQCFLTSRIPGMGGIKPDRHTSSPRGNSQDPRKLRLYRILASC
jgi:hypothetical protein